MTMPHEEQFSLEWAGKFLLAILQNKSLPKDTREEARRVLRHYPNRFRIAEFYREKAQ